MTNQELKIIIGGDVVPTKSNVSYLMSGQEDLVFNGVKSTLKSADVAIVNLECPLTNYDVSITKEGPCLKADPKSIEGLLSAGINVFSLANNHIMDFGTKGLEETLALITEKQAFSVGAGMDSAKAREILYINKKGYKIAVISSAEHEFSIAQDDSPGANPFDPYDTLEDIRRAKQEADLVIVLYHGGIEHYRYPSPSVQKLCRKVVEQGADVVVCQHSHCIGAYETYEGGHIVYGQGNLLFDASNHPMWQDGMILEISLHDKKVNVGFVPIVKKDFVIDLANGKDKENILNDFAERSKSIASQAFVKSEWIKFCETRRYHYLYTFLGFGLFLRRLDRRLNHVFSNRMLNSEKLVVLYNFLNCEAHLDVQKTFLEQSYQKKSK
jgi:poly-gamma-glutamate synthesis protein (capsule biosynthesis protein)